LALDLTSLVKDPSIGLRALQPDSSSGAGLARPAGGEGVTGFVRALGETLREANGLQDQASQGAEALARGEDVSLHRVMVETQEASLAFQLTLAVRNKVLEAYQEVLRMQV